jgi:hypothetical protein
LPHGIVRISGERPHLISEQPFNRIVASACEGCKNYQS